MSAIALRIAGDRAARGQLARRATVVAAVLLWAALASPLPTSLDGFGTPLVAALAGLGVGLNQATGWRAWRASSRLDERESVTRDHAYRLAFRGAGIGLFLLILSWVVNIYLPQPPWRPPLSFAGGPRLLLALVILVAVLPGAMLAWLEGGLGPGGGWRPRQPRGASSWPAPAAAVLSAIVVLGLWTAAIAGLPPRTVSGTQSPSRAVTYGGAKCATLETSRELGGGLGAALVIDENVCWNGRQAWDGDLARGQPATERAVPEGCALALDSSSFEDISAETCRALVEADGTFRIDAVAQVSTWIPGLLDRTLSARIVVTDQGRITWPS